MNREDIRIKKGKRKGKHKDKKPNMSGNGGKKSAIDEIGAIY
uniref:Uncharacterized protein n=1 Tax=Nelumbo nucifera TaxID=4432 RepID=A0A822Z3M2_NELNU|nr:TPA_asm: hypothetical protein HUJ06_013720 [Nelumbo nucifera]